MRSEQQSDWFDSLFFWNSTTSTSSVHALAAWALAAALMAIGYSVYSGRTLWRNVAMLPALIWVTLLLSTVSWDRTQRGVVVAGELTARTADSATSAPRLASPVPSGTELQVLESREDWHYVKLPGGQSVWLPASGLELIP